MLIIHFDGIDEQFVAAFNKLDGKIAWRTKRAGEMHERKEFRKAYCTPTIIEDSNRTQLISPGANWLYSYDPQTGKEQFFEIFGTLWGPQRQGNGRNFCQTLFSSTPNPNAHFCEISLFYHFYTKSESKKKKIGHIVSHSFFWHHLGKT